MMIIPLFIKKRIFTFVANKLYIIYVKILQLSTFESDARDLTVFEKILPEDIKRIFYIRGKKSMKK